MKVANYLAVLLMASVGIANAADVTTDKPAESKKAHAHKKCAEIMEVLKEAGMIKGGWISITALHEKIGIAVGIDKRTHEQYSRALCTFGYLRAGTCFNFEILKFPGEADEKHSKENVEILSEAV